MSRGILKIFFLLTVWAWINQSLDSKIFIQVIEIPMDDYNTTKRITFSGKIQTRIPIGIIIVAGQNGLSDPISFFF